MTDVTVQVTGSEIEVDVAGPGTTRLVQTVTGMQAAAPYVGGSGGSILRKFSGHDGDIEYVAPGDFSKQLAVNLDLSDDQQYQVVGTNVSEFSWAIDGTDIVFTSSLVSGAQHCWANFGETIELGNSYYVKGTISEIGTGTAGIVIGFTTTAPTRGGADANISAEAWGVVYRENGGNVSYDDTGNASEAGVSFAPGGLGATFAEDDIVELFFTPLTTTTYNFKVYVNSVFASEKIVTAPSVIGKYFCAGVNLRQNGQEGRLQAAAINIESIDMPLRIVVDADAAGGGDGSVDAPFNNFDDVNDMITRDKRRRHLALYGRGVFEGQCLYADQNQWRRIEVIGSVGQEFVIDASEPYAPTWTQIGVTDRWYATHPGYDDNNVSYGGLIEVTSGITDSFGLNGDFTIDDEVIQNRVAPNTDPASALYVNGDYGSFSVHYLATYVPAGSVVVRCADGGDPNTKTWRWIRKAGAINFAPADDTGLMASFVRLANVTGKRGFLYNIRAERSFVDISNCHAPGGLGFGMELNHSFGRVFASSANGTMLDNCHWSDGGTALEVQLTSEVDFCEFQGGGNRPYGQGDCLSNHNPLGHKVIVKNTKLVSAGKHCISTNGAIEVVNCLLQDGLEAGFSMSAVAGVSGQTAKITGTEICRNYDGVIHNLGSLTDIDTEIEVECCQFHDNANTDVRGYAAGAGSSDHTIIDRCDVTGPIPPGEGNRILMEDANSTYTFIARSEFSEATRT